MAEKGPKLVEGELTERIIGAAIEVHKSLGPGLLESAYEECMCHEFRLRGIPFSRQQALDIMYKGSAVGSAYKLDLLVDERVIVELKAVTEVAELHRAQLLTYLRLSGKPVGLLINFNVPVLKDGITRVVQ